MKYLITAVLSIFVIAACTNSHRKTRTETMKDDNRIVRIEEDGQILNMKVRIKNTENTVDFNESFDIREMNEKQVKKLKTHILDSLYKIK